MAAALALAGTFAVAALITALLVPPVQRLCARRGWMAQPAPRRVHKVATATVGGLAMLVGLAGALLLTLLLERLVPELRRSGFEHLRLALLAAGALVVAAISFADDLREISPYVRLPIHFGAALVAVGPYVWDHTLYPDIGGAPTEARGIILTAFNFPFIDQIHLHNIAFVGPWLAIAATLVWIVGITNMVNWADGLDGLAAGITLIAAAILALHALRLNQLTVALLPLALAGACAGFLPFNFNPARIFMGDVGAMTLGYVLAVSAIIGGAKLATALLVLGVPLIDMGWLVVSRTLHGRSAAHAGRDHLHHRLLDLGFSQRQIVAFYYGLSAAFGTLALIDLPPWVKLAALLLLGALVLGVIIAAGARARSISGQRG
ncbi:MAG: undecaprenyl/decaprenyl-phosphate alpha-N-acetylglucosaminyl 1-phosphate transferase [Chloroflexales bacterium]|nr:undecaprenyl/decaprenyl-phosphate alpha-N-acetylglucosaminyl 1-phosphate transferase [Chloroflexales bacterium]